MEVKELKVGDKVSFAYLSSDGMVVCRSEITGFTDKFVKYKCGLRDKKTRKDKIFGIKKLN